MGAHLDMFAKSEYDTDYSGESERDMLIRKATERIDDTILEKERKLKFRSAYDKAQGREHIDSEGSCDGNLDTMCQDCIEECDYMESPSKREQDARDWFNSGQPMGEGDH
jgi:hypothetical protein